MDELTTTINGIKYVKFHREIRDECVARELMLAVQTLKGIVVDVKYEGVFYVVVFLNILIPEEYALVFSNHY